MQSVKISQLSRSFVSNLTCSFSWAWMDVKCRYRRSVIGPFWETINVLVLLLGMSLISSVIFGTSPLANLPFIGLGVITWSAIAAIVNESTGCFIAHKDLIKNSTMGIDVYVGRTIFRIFITTAHHLILYFIGLIFLPFPFSVISLLSFIGWAILFINAFWLMPTLGLVCSRFRDLEMVVRNIMQLIFYATPIFWNYHSVENKYIFVLKYNPFFYFLEVVRAPLLGEVPPIYYYAILLCVTMAGYILLFILYKKMRKSLSFFV